MKQCKGCRYARGANDRCYYKLITDQLRERGSPKSVMKLTGVCPVRKRK